MINVWLGLGKRGLGYYLLLLLLLGFGDLCHHDYNNNHMVKAMQFLLQYNHILYISSYDPIVFLFIRYSHIN